MVTKMIGSLGLVVLGFLMLAVVAANAETNGVKGRRGQGAPANQERLNHAIALENRAARLTARAEAIADTRPARAAVLLQRADSAATRANNITPVNTGVNIYNRKVAQLSRTLENNPANTQKINRLTTAINDRVIPNGLARMERKVEGLTTRADYLQSRAASLNPQTDSRRIERLSNKSNSLNAVASWIKTKTETALQPVQ